MSRRADAGLAALKTYKAARETGAGKDVAVRTATAKYRALYPTASEAPVRQTLARLSAEENLERHGARFVRRSTGALGSETYGVAQS